MPDTPTTYGKTALIDDIAAATTGYTRRQVTEILEAALAAIERQSPAARG